MADHNRPDGRHRRAATAPNDQASCAAPPDRAKPEDPRDDCATVFIEWPRWPPPPRAGRRSPVLRHRAECSTSRSVAPAARGADARLSITCSACAVTSPTPTALPAGSSGHAPAVNTSRDTPWATEACRTGSRCAAAVSYVSSRPMGSWPAFRPAPGAPRRRQGQIRPEQEQRQRPTGTATSPPSGRICRPEWWESEAP